MTLVSTWTRTRVTVAVAGICFVGFLAGCQSKQEKVESAREDLQEERTEVAEEQQDVTQAVEELNEAQRQASAEWQQDYLTFKKEMVGELSENEQLILDKRAEIAGAEPARQDAATRSLETAEQRNNELRNNLNNAMDAGTEAWAKFKDDLRRSANEVEEAIKSIHV